MSENKSKKTGEKVKEDLHKADVKIREEAKKVEDKVKKGKK
jgi:hypothetical protein